MLSGLLHKLITTLFANQNQFASGGMLLMVIGAIGAMFRQIPAKIWAWIVHQTTISLSVTDDNTEYKWLRKWMQEQSIMKRSRHIDVATGRKWTSEEVPTVLGVSPGSHWMLYRGRPMVVKMSRIDDTKSEERRESIQFTTVGRNQEFLRNLIEDVKKHRSTIKAAPKLFVWGGKLYSNAWEEVNEYQPRSLDTVFFSGNIKQELIKDIEAFRQSKQWYNDMGIPYHRGYLFEGPPGTGKTSLVVGLSSKFNVKVYVLKISEMNDNTLQQAVNQADPNSFIVLEDADCMKSRAKKKTKKDKAKKKKAEDGVVPPVWKAGEADDDKERPGNVTLSGLLNVLDGMLAPSGVMFFMTTNHPEKLDPALIRPGRIDVIKHIGMADNQQKVALYARFFPGQAIPDDLLKKSMTMAELQQILMERRNSLTNF